MLKKPWYLLTIFFMGMLLLFPVMVATAANSMTGGWIPMIDMDTSTGQADIFVYNTATKIITKAKEDIHATFPDISPDQTKIVYVENDKINVYDIASNTTTTVKDGNTDGEAYFSSDGKILFVDTSDGKIKNMEADGSNIGIVASPADGYKFSYFAPSPDRTLIAAIENIPCQDYYSCNKERGVLLSAAGSRHSEILAEYTGEWNLISWKPDSTGFLYYYHTFSGSEQTPKYTIFDVSDPSSPTITNLSGSAWSTDENVCFYTTSGNLLSFTDKKLYNGQTGALIKAADIPTFGKAMFGFSATGDIYFANTDGTNFRKFDDASASTSTSAKLTIEVGSAQSEIGTGTGKITSTGISCSNTSGTTSTDCDQTYTKATKVTLKATADKGSSFKEWTGCDSNPSTATCVVNISSGDMEVTAIFEPTPRHQVIVTKDGNGAGTVRSSQKGIEADGINCDVSDTDCSETYVEKTNITLVAIPAKDGKSKFVRWEGAACGAAKTASCRISKIIADAEVTAVFGYPMMELSTETLEIGAGLSQPLTITNSGVESLTVSFSVSGSGKKYFKTYDSADVAVKKATIGEGESGDFAVGFSEDAKQSTTATLTIKSNDPDKKTVTIQLTGTK